MPKYSDERILRMTNEKQIQVLRHDQKCRKMKLFQDMQLIQKLRNDQKCMKKVVEDILAVRAVATWQAVIGQPPPRVS
ncbi:hypothetical protein Tco_1231231 [Tanacetum coccineum]